MKYITSWTLPTGEGYRVVTALASGMAGVNPRPAPRLTGTGTANSTEAVLPLGLEPGLGGF